MTAYDYFKGIAQSNVDINHLDGVRERFVRGKIGEMVGNLNLSQDHFIMIFYNLEGDSHGKNVDQLYENSLVNFAIVKGCEKGNYNLKQAIEDQALIIGNDIKAKIYRDYENKVLSLQDLTIKHTKFKPGMDGEAGYLFQVDINFSTSINYNPAKWQ